MFLGEQSGPWHHSALLHKKEGALLEQTLQGTLSWKLQLDQKWWQDVLKTHWGLAGCWADISAERRGIRTPETQPTSQPANPQGSHQGVLIPLGSVETPQNQVQRQQLSIDPAAAWANSLKPLPLPHAHPHRPRSPSGVCGQLAAPAPVAVCMVSLLEDQLTGEAVILSSVVSP